MTRWIETEPRSNGERTWRRGDERLQTPPSVDPNETSEYELGRMLDSGRAVWWRDSEQAPL